LILKKAERLDLTVEALVVDKQKPYHGEFDFDVVQIAKQRLADHGLDVLAPEAPETLAATPSEGQAGLTGSSIAEVPLTPGRSVDVRVTVGEDGKLSLALI
jgi:hypothetical protein